MAVVVTDWHWLWLWLTGPEFVTVNVTLAMIVWLWLWLTGLEVVTVIRASPWLYDRACDWLTLNVAVTERAWCCDCDCDPCYDCMVVVVTDTECGYDWQRAGGCDCDPCYDCMVIVVTDWHWMWLWLTENLRLWLWLWPLLWLYSCGCDWLTMNMVTTDRAWGCHCECDPCYNCMVAVVTDWHWMCSWLTEPGVMTVIVILAMIVWL